MALRQSVVGMAVRRPVTRSAKLSRLRRASASVSARLLEKKR